MSLLSSWGCRVSGSLVRVAGVVCASVLVVAGCGGDPEPGPVSDPGASEPTEATAEPSEEPNEAEGPEPIPTEYPGEVVSFAELPDLRGKWRQGLKTYVDYERGRFARSEEIHELVVENAAPLERVRIEDGIAYDRDRKIERGGSVAIEILDVQRDGDAMRIELCLDLTESWIREDGKLWPPYEVPGRSVAMLLRGEDGWQVMSRVPVRDANEEQVPC